LNLEKLLVKFTLKKNFKRYANILCTIIIIFLLRNIKIEPISDEWSLQNEVTIINIYKNNCDLANNKLDQYKIWILINFYPKQCYYYYDEKMKNANDSYSEAKIFEKIERLKLVFSFIMIVLVLAITYWVYKLDI